MTKQQPNPTGRKVYTDPNTGEKKKGALVPIAQIRADEIWAQVKPYLDQHEIAGNRYLVACYIQPEVTQMGIIIPDSVRQEDIWQGVTGLIIQAGPGVCVDSDKWKFYGQKWEVGDWVTFRPSDSILQTFGGPRGRECRIIQDCYVLSKVTGPHVCF